MSQAKRVESEAEPVRVLGRGLRAQRGVRLTLRVLREAAAQTQGDVAHESGIDQSDISRLESRKDFDECQVSTLRRYLSSLGGELELVAAFGNKRITLVGAEPPLPANTALPRPGRKPARR